MSPRLLQQLSFRHYVIISISFTLIVLAIFYLGGETKAEKTSANTLAYHEYISAYTGGVISRQATIRIRFAQIGVDSTQIGKPAAASLLRFKPSISGETFWTDAQTLEFRPTEALPSGQAFEGTLFLDKIFEVEGGLEEFKWQLQVIPQYLEVHVQGFRPYSSSDLSRQKIIGRVITSDVPDEQNLQKVLTASQNGKTLPMSWEHAGEQHRFTIEEVTRGDAPGEVELTWSGKPVLSESQGKEVVRVPPLSEFDLVNVRVVQSPDQYVSIEFSDPLQPSQQLEGLITLREQTGDLKFQINQNEVRVFPVLRQAGEQELHIFPGVKNTLDYPLGKKVVRQITFEQLKPSVRFVKSGNILPHSEIRFPFEAVSLKAVRVEVIKIFANNIPQFFQTNRLDGNQELRRVGRPVARKKIELQTAGVADLGKWNRYYIDLKELIRSDPGAIYQIRIGFRKQDISFFCADEEPSGLPEEEQIDDWEEAEDPYSYWDGYEQYYYYDDYNWQERDNPCSSSYYGSRRSISRNLIASELGLLAKISNAHQMQVYVTDLNRADPLSGVQVELLDYQLQRLGEYTTSSEGKVQIDLVRKPFLLVASHQGQKGYLKLDDGSSNSLSNFDVSGRTVEQGMKGFIYAERGVWRPGDSLHIAFMLEADGSEMPNQHPVVFEFTNPLGQITHRAVRTSETGGIYYFAVPTQADAPTGNWSGTVRVGGATFSKTFPVEAIKPNRLKILLDFGKKQLSAGDNVVTGDLQVNWLHGAPAANLKAEFDVVLRSTQTQFSGFESYDFEDPVRRFTPETQPIFNGYVNDEGKAQIYHQINTSVQPPGLLSAQFLGRVYEEGGNFSVDRFSIPYYPYRSFVGIMPPKGDRARGMLLTDTTHRLDVVTLTPSGKPSTNRNVDISMYKLEWRWWWDQSSDYVSSYVANNSNNLIAHSQIRTNQNGRGSWNFNVEYPDWGRYLIRACDEQSGHCTGSIVYLDWPGWAGRAQRDFPGAASMLSFSTDKESYKVGEPVTVHIPGSKSGRALVSIESGSRIVDSYWMETEAGETTFTFPATAEMAPNIYVHISLLQPHQQTENDLPIRLYGIQPVAVIDPETRLSPQIAMSDELEPLEKVSIKVSEKSGRAMAYTLAVVDEGLLDLTRFSTPEPWSSFYAREALGVRTWDIYEDVIGAYGARLERLFSVGGDMEAEPVDETSKANRFKPVVEYMGPYFLKKGETNTHQFTMPQYIGSVRTMLVAGFKGAYGSTEKTTPVKQPLMVMGTLPRVLGPGEEVALPVTVFSYRENLNEVQVKVSANDLFESVGPATQRLQFPKPGDQTIYFNLKVKKKLGIGEVAIRATGGNASAVHDISLNVRNANPVQTEVYQATLEPEKTWQTTAEFPGMAGTNRAVLEVSSIPPINLEKRMKYLLRYPHGCIEQITSAAFPQLFLADLKELSSAEQQKIDEHIVDALDQLSKFQLSSGGFAYWPGHEDENSWGTNYAGQFMLEAQAKGYQVPGSVMRGWRRYQTQKALNWQPSSGYSRSDLVQAYRLYTLALAGAPATAAMNRLREQTLSDQATWRLAAAYLIINQPAAAQDLIRKATTNIEPYQEQYITYGSQTRDYAMILETMALMKDQQRGQELLRKLSTELSSEAWMSTQTTAYSLMAIAKFVKGMSRTDDIKFLYQWGDDQAIEASTSLSLAQKELPVDGASELKITNQSDGVLFARLILSGTPVRGEDKSVSNGLEMQVRYTNMEGQTLSPNVLEQGTSFIAEVTLLNPGFRGNYHELALEQIFPSGWEIVNTRFEETDDLISNARVDYQDIRDDRVYSYLDLPAGKKNTIKVVLHASYSGTYYLPAVSCQAMYDHTVSSTIAGREVKVISRSRQDVP